MNKARAWLAEPDVRIGPFRDDQFATLAMADCGRAWLLWNTTDEGNPHPRGTLFVRMGKGTLEFLELGSG